jgi:beta-lactamase regulating signal transducer with metallopeptidase domain
MYYLLGICLAFAALLATNVLASVVAGILWRVIEQPARRWSSAARAKLLFALRTAPAAVSLICVATLLVPAFIVHEPHHSTETVGAKLTLLALLSIYGIARALWRGFATWRATRRLTIDWLRQAEPIFLDNISAPAYRIKHSFPVIAVVGILRPRLFIADYLLNTLDAEELAAALLHEEAHLRARDNFKRPIVRACRDVLSIVPCGRALDQIWTEESEVAADEYAARSGGASSALSLAASLIKIARLVPAGARPPMPDGVFLVGDAGAPLAGRVQRLMMFAELRVSDSPVAASTASLTTNFLLCCYLGLLTALIAQTHTLTAIHTAIEYVVAALQ